MRTYLTKLRSEAFLKSSTGYEDSGAAPGKNTAWEDPAQLKPETVTKEEVGRQDAQTEVAVDHADSRGRARRSTGTSSSKN